MRVTSFSLFDVPDSMFLEILCDQLELRDSKYDVVSARPGLKRSPSSSPVLFPTTWYIHRLHRINRRYIFEAVKGFFCGWK